MAERLPVLVLNQIAAAGLSRLPAEVNQLNNQVLVRYFEAEWRKVVR